MKFKIYKIITGVRNFFLEDSLSYFDDQKGLHHCDLKLTEKWAVPMDTQTMCFQNESFIVPYYSWKKFYIIDKNNGNVLIEITENFKPFLILNDIIHGVVEDDSKEYYSTFDIQKKVFVIKWILPTSYREIKILTDDLLLITFDSLLTFYSLKTGIELWRIELSEIGKTKGEQGRLFGTWLELVNDVLVAPLLNGILIGVDIITGKIIWQLPFAPHRFKLCNTLLYSIVENYIWGINPSSGEVVLKQTIEDELRRHRISVYYNFIVDNDKLYFIDVSGLKCAILNLDSYSIEWLFDFSPFQKVKNTTMQLKDIKVLGNFIYVLDSEQTLHIFEKK